MTEETALKLVADVAQRFGQDFDAKTELAGARKEHEARKAKRLQEDSFQLPAALQGALKSGQAAPGAPSHGPAPAPASAPAAAVDAA